MSFWESFWDIIWWFLWVFAFMAYLFAVFAIISDLFRDRKLNGWWKAVWIVFLLFLPFLTALIYLIARGRSMAERSMGAAQEAREASDQYIKSVAGYSASDEIAKAKGLHEAGTITAEEYEQIKARVLTA
jgi:hypothetical protein